MMPKQQPQSTYPTDFDEVSLRLASPERIGEWSYGEVTKPETINYRTQRSERGGLFDEKIFGPEKDYECYCGKYRGIRYKGIICEKCGVELTRAIVRRERMGHIELAAPVSHIWFLKGVPSRIGLLLGLTTADLSRVIYFAGYIVTKVNADERMKVLKELDSEYKGKLKSVVSDEDREELKELYASAKREVDSIAEGRVLDEVVYHRYSVRYGAMFEAGIGAEAIYTLFKNLDLNILADELEAAREKAGSVDRQRINKRLSLIRAMIHNHIRPEWMFFVRIPVIPPALRPMVALEGGRHATSDLNDLYRRVINRNNRLRKLKDINAPDVILRNEKRILQEAVDALIDNSIRGGGTSGGGAMSQAQRRPLKSLADNLKGKQGLFRANLLGKRVDYSGRSVIVVGPELRLNQCGLPKHMALELFRPFVIAVLLERELAYNIRGAGRLIDEGIPEVWAILEEVIKDKYVLLNRAPTLHRLGIQAFQPVLIEGNAIQIHPLVCTAFNADFDGDQMAVHVPLSDEAQAEAREIMAADHNLLKPATGDPIVSIDKLDMVLGSYWVTKILEGERGEGKIFADPNSAITAYDFGEVSFRAKVKVMATGSTKYVEIGDGVVFETSVGRLLFNSILPADYPFVNAAIDRKTMGRIVDQLVDRYGIEAMPTLLDRIKAFGFAYVTRSGITWGIDDVTVPDGKSAIIERAIAASQETLAQYNEGLLAPEERYRRNIDIWHATRNEVEKLIPASLDPAGSVHDMWQSGARGSLSQITQMVGMKGLIASTSGQVIEFPIISSMKEGLSPVEYFISTHGSRKGLADTALNTAKAGYLTRRLFDVAQDAIITEKKCGAKTGVWIRRGEPAGIDVPLVKNIKGRMLAADVATPDGEVLAVKDSYLSKEIADRIDAANVDAVYVYSPLTCETVRGLCQRCYGMDLGKNELVALGEAVGTVAAQAIGEPATQLTMRTFHSGGTATVGGDITTGLPRVEEVFERRLPKNPAVIATIDGEVLEVREQAKEKVIVILPALDQKVRASKQAKKSTTKTEALEYLVHFRRTPLVKAGDKVKAGDLLTDGSVDIVELFKHSNRERTQDYIIHETSRIYEMQGASVSRKHIEVIVRQMFSRVRVKQHAGDSPLVAGDIVEYAQWMEENEHLREEGLEEIKVDSLVMGISEVSLTRESFLSAASFQHTTKTLIKNAIRGSVDRLTGLKENVIIGRLIPAGTGFPGSEKEKIVREARRRREEERRMENATDEE
jgi:DNA-directed RNA polymerase subunit beta'